MNRKALGLLVVWLPLLSPCGCFSGHKHGGTPQYYERRIPSYRIPEADPSQRLPRSFDVPGRLVATRGPHQINFSWDPDFTECIELTVGYKMEVGGETQSYIIVNEVREMASEGFSSGFANLDPAPIWLDQNGLHPSTQKYTIEVTATIYETAYSNYDIHAMTSDSRTVLWTRTYRIENI
jgi:hypothetical protein